MGYHTERMASIDYGIAFGEKEADGRPQVFLSCSSLLTRLRGVVCDEDTDNGVLTAHKRGGCGAGRCARRERVLGPLWLPPPFFLHAESSFHFSSESDGVSLPQAVRSPQYSIS